MEADAISKKEFWRDGTLRTFRIPDGTRLIGDWAFYGCTELARIEIPTSIEFIGKDAFAGCDKLERACLYGEGISNEGITCKEVSCEEVSCEEVRCKELPVKGHLQNVGERACLERLLAFALRYFQGQNEIVSAGREGLKALLFTWDQACHRFLDTSDADGFRPFLAGGEEDYADDEKEREAYCRSRRLIKARIIVARLMAHEEKHGFYLERLQKNDMSLELLKETWDDPRRVVELLEEAEVLTKGNCREVLERLPEECVEMKALLLQKLSERGHTGLHAETDAELEGLFL